MKEELIALAFEFREKELWNKLIDNDIFAVRLRSGDIGYCCVMGNGGAHYALGLYVGKHGWNTYLDTYLRSPNLNHSEMVQMMCGFNCINCDYMSAGSVKPSKSTTAVKKYAKEHNINVSAFNAFPDFTRYSPGFYPGEVTDERDLEDIEDALSAAIFMSDYLQSHAITEAGFTDDGITPTDKPGTEVPFLTPERNTYKLTTVQLPGWTDIVYPEPEFNHPELVVKMATLKRGPSIECQKMFILAPVKVEGDEDKAYLPSVVFGVDDREIVSLMTQIVRNDVTDPASVVLDFAVKICSSGIRPSGVYVKNEETFALLKDFSSKTGIPLFKVSRLKYFNKFWEEFSSMIEK